MSYRVILPISFRITSLPVGQSYDCPTASEVTLTNIWVYDSHQSTTYKDMITKQQSITNLWAYIIRYVAYVVSIVSVLLVSQDQDGTKVYIAQAVISLLEITIQLFLIIAMELPWMLMRIYGLYSSTLCLHIFLFLAKPHHEQTESWQAFKCCVLYTYLTWARLSLCLHIMVLCHQQEQHYILNVNVLNFLKLSIVFKCIFTDQITFFKLVVQNLTK